MYSCGVKFVTLNFPEIFVDRLDAYAKAHGMKRNAVLKQAFELLEDTPVAKLYSAQKKAVDDAY